MRIYIILGLILGGIFAFMFFQTPFIVFLLAGGSSMITIILTVIIIKIFPKRFWPTVVNIYEDRFGGLAITKSERARRIIKDGKEMYSFIDGFKIKAPKSDCVISGNPNIVNIYTPDGLNHFPLKPEIATGYIKKTVPVEGKPNMIQDIEEPILEKGKLKLLNEDQRIFLADQIIANKKATTPPITRLQQIMPLMAVIIPAVLLIGLFVIAVKVLPDYMNEVSGEFKSINADTRMTIEDFRETMKGTVFWKEQPEPVEPPEEEEEEPPF